ncbi:MAG: hypothetical protein ACYSUT_08435 [Planctomycetota bacterium]
MQTGPELQLDYQSGTKQSNPVDSFMYFLPLISPIGISVETDPGTTFAANITSWKRTQEGKTIYVECDFDVTGKGKYAAVYDSGEMIGKRLKRETDLKKVKEITKMLEWIRLSSACLGRIEAVGKTVNGEVQMDEVVISFNRDKSQSPVEVSMYDIPNKKGQFLYANRRNAHIARINSLTFKRTDSGTPQMSVEIASLKKAKDKEGFLSHLTAMIANILSTSTAVAPVGNSTMLDFGTALYEKQSEFTFPKATNIKNM